MLGRCQAAKRPDTGVVLGGLDNPATTLGYTTFAINDNARWRSFPADVWDYKSGRYQFPEKWMSYLDRQVLGHNLTPEDARHFPDTARQIAAILAVVSRE